MTESISDESYCGASPSLAASEWIGQSWLRAATIICLLAAIGCSRQADRPRIGADIVPLPEHPGAEIVFLQSRDQVTGIRARREGDWFDVPADRVDDVFKALQPTGIVTRGSKCEFMADVHLQGEGQSLSVLVHHHGGPNQFGAHGEYKQADRTIPLYFAGADAERLTSVLSEAQAAAKASE